MAGAVPRRGRAKGSVVRPMLDWAAAAFGARALEEIAWHVPAEQARAIVIGAPALGIGASSWVDERVASALADGVFAVAKRSMREGDVLAAIGRATVDASLGRISRALIAWFASPESSAATAPLVWGLYHDTGTVAARVEGLSMFASCAHWVAHGAAWCKVVGASAVRVLEINGCVRPCLATHTCRGGDGRSCAMTLRWDARGGASLSGSAAR